MTNTKGLSSLSPDPLAWDCLTQEAVNLKESVNSLVDPMIERFPENVNKKKSKESTPNLYPLQVLSCMVFYLNNPLTTGPPLSCVDIVNRISYSTKTTIVRGVVATMGGYTSYQPKTTVGVPVAGGKPLPFRPWFLFGSNLPQPLDPLCFPIGI